MLPNSTATRDFQPTGVGRVQEIHDTKFATLTLAAAVLPGVTKFFAAAPSSDPCSDRYEQGNTIVTSAKKYTIAAIAAQLLATSATALADIEKVCDYCSLRIVTASKEYGVFPLYMLPAGGGVSAPGGQVSITPAAVPGAQSYFGVTNGIPSRSAMFVLARPLEIQANQSFWIELLAPSGTGAFGAQTITGTVTVRIVLDGLEERPAA